MPSVPRRLSPLKIQVSVQLPTSADNVALPAAAAVQQSIDIYYPPGPQEQTRRGVLVGQTDRRTPDSCKDPVARNMRALPLPPSQNRQYASVCSTPCLGCQRGTPRICCQRLQSLDLLHAARSAVNTTLLLSIEGTDRRAHGRFIDPAPHTTQTALITSGGFTLGPGGTARPTNRG